MTKSAEQKRNINSTQAPARQEEASSMALPLHGIRIVEMSHMIMGPSCGMVLAQLGAEVIKVEPPGGDKTRTLGGMGVGFFPIFNRGKRSVTLDLATPAGRAAMDRLLATADAFVENFRDDTIAKAGRRPRASEEVCKIRRGLPT